MHKVSFSEAIGINFVYAYSLLFQSPLHVGLSICPQLSAACSLEPSGLLPKTVHALDQAILAELRSPDNATADAELLQAENSAEEPTAATPDQPEQKQKGSRLKVADVPGNLVALAKRCGLDAPSETQYIQAGECLESWQVSRQWM